jgi:predicted DNA-binding protein
MFTAVVYCGEEMKRHTTAKQGKRRSMSASLVRASISFPPDLYETLQELANQKKVSLAWVVRDAAEKYVAKQQ